MSYTSGLPPELTAATPREGSSELSATPIILYSVILVVLYECVPPLRARARALTECAVHSARAPGMVHGIQNAVNYQLAACLRNRPLSEDLTYRPSDLQTKDRHEIQDSSGRRWEPVFGQMVATGAG
eukprot:COSAG02_NODE_4466_length_5332_cov_3.159564_3_plen_127_part_00